MKKIQFALILSLLIFPSIVLASWWNPFSWFQKKVVQPPVVQVSTPTTTSSNDKQIEDLKKQGEELKKKSESQNKTTTPATVLPVSITTKSNIVLTTGAFWVPKNGTSVYYPFDCPAKSTYKDINKTWFATEQDAINAGYTLSLGCNGKVVKGTQNKIIAPVLGSTSKPATITYSDYNFDYSWTQREGFSYLHCPSTPRSILLKKAVFKISDAVSSKLKENDTAVTNFYSAIPLERVDNNTLLYLGNWRICGWGINSDGSNMPVIGYYSNGAFVPLEFTAQMSEWEVHDQTTNKPVKIN